MAKRKPVAMKTTKSNPGNRFEGNVYDIDFIRNNGFCQVLILGKNQKELVAVTTELRMQSILETSMIMKLPVEVYYEESDVNTNTLTRVKLNLSAPA